MARSRSPWDKAFGRPARRPRNPFAKPKAEDEPAPRRMEIEQSLCEAIERHVLVSLYYEDDIAPRLFSPSVVYRTTKDKICAYGIQQGDGPHNFEVGKMRNVQLTETKYAPEPINRLDDRYRNGVLCCA